MAAAPDVASLVSRAQQLSSTPQGLDALHTALEQSADLLKANAAEALAALETRALDPQRHALAWTHFLRAAVASTRVNRKRGERSTADGPGSLLPGTLSAPAERGNPVDDDDDDDDAATTEANDEEHPPLTSGGALLPARDAMDGVTSSDAFHDDDENLADGGDVNDAYYDAVGYQVAEETTGADESSARALLSSFPAFRKIASELLSGSDEGVNSETDTTFPSSLTETSSHALYDSSSNTTSASAQVRRCPLAFAEVSGAFTGCALSDGSKESALAAIAPLRSALRAARPTTDHLTKQHAFLFSLCVKCGRVDVVSNDVDSCPVFETDPKRTCVDATDYLKYCSFGGDALLKLGRYKDAAELFLRLTTAPATSTAALHAVSHKKYILCSLLAEGNCAFTSTLPSYASPAVQRHVRGAGAAYASFAEAFATGSVAKTNARFDESKEAFEKDGGEMRQLAETALGSLKRRAVRKLTETHISSSLADIASVAELTGGEAEAERVVLEMIDAREIYAKIDFSTRSVTFLDAADDPFAAEEEAAALTKAVAEARGLAERVRRKDDTLRASRAYVNATADLGAAGPAGGKAKPEEGKRIPGDGDGEEDD